MFKILTYTYDSGAFYWLSDSYLFVQQGRLSVVQYNFNSGITCQFDLIKKNSTDFYAYSKETQLHTITSFVPTNGSYLFSLRFKKFSRSTVDKGACTYHGGPGSESCTKKILKTACDMISSVNYKVSFYFNSLHKWQYNKVNQCKPFYVFFHKLMMVKKLWLRGIERALNSKKNGGLLTVTARTMTRASPGLTRIIFSVNESNDWNHL